MYCYECIYDEQLHSDFEFKTPLVRLKLHMMYSQQEYDMVRRQTMQIEAEKRALLKWVLVAVSLLLAGSVIFIGWKLREYSAADERVRSAEERKAAAENQLLQVSREHDELKGSE